jgi:hypothetical protein
VVVRLQCAGEWLEIVHANFDACAAPYAACATDAITDGGTDSLADGSTDGRADFGTNDGDHPSNARSSAHVGGHSRSVYAGW